MSHLPPRAVTRLAAALLSLTLPLLATLPTAYGADGDPNLDQTIDAAEPIVHGDHVIASGHVDMGPKFDAGQWRFLIHDDAHKADAGAPSVWRYPDETVLRVVDAAELRVPDDRAYSFVGASPGTTVWVVPQTQNPDVIWTGWNTQDPTVMQRVDRGATFSVTGVEGPGVLTVYLQSGDFGAPQVLWDSRKSEAQPTWVDANTHTHANWVFTKPGVYLVQMQASATLTDGSTVSDTQLLRFAVGSDTSTGTALQTAWHGATPPPVSATPSTDPTVSSAPPSATQPGTAATESSSHALAIAALVAAIVVVAALLVAGFAWAAVRSGRTRREILASRVLDAAPTDDPKGDAS